MSGKRIISSMHGVTLSEHELSDGRTIIAKTYSVKSRRTPMVPNFSNLLDAEIYRDLEIAQVLASARI
jgi:hypothetical protein